jgi:hypothetical protein
MRVDFPLPDGPKTAINSPFAALKDTPLRAGTKTFPILYAFLMSLASSESSIDSPLTVRSFLERMFISKFKCFGNQNIYPIALNIRAQGIRRKKLGNQ